MSGKTLRALGVAVCVLPAAIGANEAIGPPTTVIPAASASLR